MDGMNGKYSRHTRSAYEISGNDTGYGSKSRKAVRMTPRGNGKSGMTAVKFLMEAVGTEMMIEMIKETDIGTDEEDIEDIVDTEVQ